MTEHAQDDIPFEPADIRGFIKRFCPAEIHPYIDRFFDLPQAELSSTLMAGLMESAGWLIMGSSHGGVVEQWFDNPIGKPFLDSVRRYQSNIGLYNNSRERKLIRDYNGRLLVPQENGGMRPVEFDAIHALFKGAPERWPDLVLTANHALAREPKDIWEVANGVHHLMEQVSGKKIDVIRDPANPPANAAGHVLIVSACHARENTLLNGARLLTRVHELRSRSSRFNADTEHAPGEQSAHYISPAAIQLAHTMLALLVEDPAQVGAAQSKLGDLSKYRDCLSAAIGAPKGPITLRADAAEVARHIKLAGYSMAGNTVTDAVRLLAYELGVENAFSQKREGRDQATKLGASDIKDIVGSLNVLALAAGEVPLTGPEKSRGIHRLSILNRHDQVAGHFYVHSHSHYTKGGQDNLILVNGAQHGLGHDPNDAMRGDGKDIGYLAANEQARKALAEFFRPVFERGAQARQGADAGAWRA